MHFEVLVEDQSGKKALDILIPKIIGNRNTFRVISYKGVGRIPKNMKAADDPARRILLDNLPRLLRGYGQTRAGYPKDYQEVVIVVCDLDNRCRKVFRRELLNILENCRSRPEARFCLAIEEGEAWYLGDIPAVKRAYPKAKDGILNHYKNDDICGTWECLADAVYPGGTAALLKKGWIAVGKEKSAWAEKISPFMDINANLSPSFRYFRDKVRKLAE